MCKEKYIVWGTNDLGKYVAFELLRNNKTVILCDNKKSGDLLFGQKILSSQELNRISNLKEYVALITGKNAKTIYEMMEELDLLGILNIGIVKYRVLIDKTPIVFEEENEEIVWYKKDGVSNHILPRIEFNVVDGCNLNCVACSHFSSIFSKNSVVPFEQYKKDILRLKDIGEIVRLRFVGGEPLLVTNLDVYLDYARNILPNSDIELVTNGLMIPNMNDRIFNSIKDNKIRVTISPYKPTVAIKDKIEEILETNGISWEFYCDSIEYFYRNLTLTPTHDGATSSRKCLNSGCLFLRNGRMYKCSYEGLFNELCNHYGKESFEYFEGIDLYDEDTDEIYNSIRNIAINPVKMCSYCSERNEVIPWHCNCNPIFLDWFSEN